MASRDDQRPLAAANCTDRGLAAIDHSQRLRSAIRPGSARLTRQPWRLATTTRCFCRPARDCLRKNVAGALRARRGTRTRSSGCSVRRRRLRDTTRELARTRHVARRRGLPEGLDIHDAYAASDLVVMPSTWEGFGNPVLESVTHRRPLAVYPYPVLEEIRLVRISFFRSRRRRPEIEFISRRTRRVTS